MILNDLLALRLDEVVGVVLTHLLVDAAREANHRLGPSMTHINTDHHSSLFVKHLGELEVVQVATSLGVDLPNDVGRFRQTELASVS